MQKIGIIGGTGSDLPLPNMDHQKVATPYGEVPIFFGTTDEGVEIVFLARHGENHHVLSNMINHRANLYALKEKGVGAILACTSAGLIDTSLELASCCVFDDLFFPDNRLPGGEPCTFFNTPGEKGRGHLIAPSHFSPSVRGAFIQALKSLDISHTNAGTYCYALGPRFNSVSEIKSMKAVGGTMVSQTAGPEAILAAELDIPYALLGFATDYANGVSEVPSSIEELNENIARAKDVFKESCLEAARILASQETLSFDTGFNYRFD